MGNLLTSVLNSANAMRVLDRQLAVLQNNVSNANTPGYVRQTQTQSARSFNLDTGLPGGVDPGPVLSSRSEYAEQGVRRQQSQRGHAQQTAEDLAQIESLFDLASQYGVSSSLSKFFQSFSQLSVNPNDQVARQSVIDRAGELAQSINHTALGLSAAANNADRVTRDSVDTVNRLVGQLRDLNEVLRSNYQSASDAGLDAKVHATMEELAEYVDFSVLEESDGTLSLYLGGQTPLLVGDHQFKIQADFSLPQTAILDTTGQEITSQFTGGRLRAGLDEKNALIPAYFDELNRLSQELADTVNLKLAAGVDANGSPPVTDLFTYDAIAGSALSLTVTAITPDQIAAASATAPGGNSNALDIAALVDSRLLDGFTFTQYFGNLGARVGRDLSTARENQATQTAMVAQARSLRDQVSAVSLDEEAVKLLQVQRAYQAAGRFLSVLNDITDTLMDVLRV